MTVRGESVSALIDKLEKPMLPHTQYTTRDRHVSPIITFLNLGRHLMAWRSLMVDTIKSLLTILQWGCDDPLQLLGILVDHLLFKPRHSNADWSHAATIPAPVQLA